MSFVELTTLCEGFQAGSCGGPKSLPVTFPGNQMVAPDATPHAPMGDGGRCGPLTTMAEGDVTHFSMAAALSRPARPVLGAILLWPLADSKVARLDGAAERRGRG